MATARYYEGFNIVGNAFQYELRSFGHHDMIYGEFTSPTLATGTYRSTQTAQQAGGTSWDSGDITWSAKKVSGPPTPTPIPETIEMEIEKYLINNTMYTKRDMSAMLPNFSFWLKSEMTEEDWASEDLLGQQMELLNCSNVTFLDDEEVRG